MIPFLIWLCGAIFVAAGSSYFSDRVNQQSGYGLIGILVFGFFTSIFWWYCSKVSGEYLLRNSLIWDTVYVATFSLVLVYFGHGANYELKHWVGIGLLAISFIYWQLLEWL